MKQSDTLQETQILSTWFCEGMDKKGAKIEGTFLCVVQVGVTLFYCFLLTSISSISFDLSLSSQSLYVLSLF